MSWVWSCPVRVASGFALVRGCLSTSSALGLSWVGSRPVFPTASLFAVALSTVRCDSRRLVPPCWLTASSLLAHYWLACGTVQHCTALYSTAQKNRAGRCWAVVGFVPSTRLLLPGFVWVVIGFCPPCLVWIALAVWLRLAPSLAPPGLSCLVASRSLRRSGSSSGFRPGWLSPLHALLHPGRPVRFVSVRLAEDSLEGSLRVSLPSLELYSV